MTFDRLSETKDTHHATLSSADDAVYGRLPLAGSLRTRFQVRERCTTPSVEAATIVTLVAV
jgi:hypothetical protein